MLSAGAEHTCVVTSNDALACWGSNSYGALGNPGTSDSYVPVEVPGMTGITSIASGQYHTCAVTQAGAVTCFGGNFHGELGDGTTMGNPMPRLVPGLSSVVSVATGGFHNCAVGSSGAVTCWGWNAFGQVGSGSIMEAHPPVVVALPKARAVTAGNAHSCALTKAGAVMCWGSNEDGQLGDGGLTASAARVAVVGLGSGVVAIAAGASHTCALTSAGAVTCWGANYSGQLGHAGLGATGTSHVPVAVNDLPPDVVAIAAGASHTCGLTASGAVACWGWNGWGQLGDGTKAPRTTPIQPAGLASGVVAIAAGGAYTCAAMGDGGLKCWGYNATGQLGDGTTETRMAPVDVVGF